MKTVKLSFASFDDIYALATLLEDREIEFEENYVKDENDIYGVPNMFLSIKESSIQFYRTIIEFCQNLQLTKKIDYSLITK